MSSSIAILSCVLLIMLFFTCIKTTSQNAEQFTFLSAAEEVCGSNITPACIHFNRENIVDQCFRDLATANGSCPPECRYSFNPMCLDCMSKPCDQYCLTDGPESFACQECLSFCDSAW